MPRKKLRIVIEGAPAAGKTVVLKILSQQLIALGYKVRTYEGMGEYRRTQFPPFDPEIAAQTDVDIVAQQ